MVYKLDRLGRDPRLILNGVNELESIGVQAKSMTEPFDTGNPAGRFMLTMLAGVAGLERDTIVERSLAGSDRLVRAGAWMGGIVPFGYRVEGKDREARLVISEEPLPGMDLSEADVVRLIFRMLANERRSCVEIADSLNNLGMPPAYSKDGRKLLRGKRKQTTAGIWRPGRIRNLVVNTTYKGIHRYGKRSKRAKEPIERLVPALVDVDTWDQAQATLREHRTISKNPENRQYLLRGLIKCGTCGLTYSGAGWRDRGNEIRTYYRCNGAQAYRGIYGSKGQKCPSKAISGDIEDWVWADIEEFLRDPGAVLEQLAQSQQVQAGEQEQLDIEIARANRALEAKAGERDAVIGLYRRGRIDDATLDRQMDEIDKEETGLKAELGLLKEQAGNVKTATERLHSADALLQKLSQKLEEPLSWESKRELVETLVDSIVVDTEVRNGKKEAVVHVTYRFAPASFPMVTLAENHTGRGSSRPRA